MKTKKMKFGLFLKILVVANLCMIIPLVACSLIITNSASKSMEENACTTLKTIAKKEVIAIEDYIASQKVLAASIASNTSVIEQGMAYFLSGVYGQWILLW